MAIVGLTIGALGFAGTRAQAAGSLPCDIYASGGTPCVAAHSTVRALFSAYNGSLYQVRRASNNATLNIGVLSAGGFANAAAQDSFCAGTTCVITIIYDQSGHGNNLTQAPGGGESGGPDTLANANALPLTVSGHHVYGVYVAPGTGYRNDHTSGIATGNNSEGEYAIFDGTHFNGGCCFDYGNAETSNDDTGNGHMEAIYFGNIKVWGYGSGNGPWVMADLENGLFSGANVHLNSGDQSITSHYVTAIVKGGPNLWAIKAGNAQSGGLTTMYSGPRPNVSGYNPMHKEGAIILGIGGDNSKGSAGSFFEGAMTSGYPSDATENAVQANIVATGYSSGGGTGGVLRGVGSNRCLDVPGAVTTNGTLLSIYDCNGGSNQQWTSQSNGELQVYGNKCLDVPNHATTAGTRVEIYDCNDGANQQWTLNSNGTVVGRESGLCLDVTGAGTANGTAVEIWTCTGSSNQKWTRQ
jgi:non-reducing end alpha-L-arabinofuranosidase